MKSQGPLMYSQCWGPFQLIGIIIFPSTSQVQLSLFACLMTCNYQLMKDLSFGINVLWIPMEDSISIYLAPPYYNHTLLPFKFPSWPCYFFMYPSLSKVALVKIRTMRAHRKWADTYLPVYTIYIYIYNMYVYQCLAGLGVNTSFTLELVCSH